MKSLGLTSYEAQVYCALVGTNGTKVQELSNSLTVPRPQVYLALKRLVARGMCIEHRGKVNRYSAVLPSIAFKEIMANEKEQLRAKAKGIAELDRTHKQRVKRADPFEFVEVLKGQRIRQTPADLYKKAEKEILVFCKKIRDRNEKEMNATLRREMALLRKGIKVRCLYGEQCLKDREFIPFVRKLVDAGEVGRVAGTLPMNMVIVDKQAATFSLSTREDDITVFLFNHPSLVTVMIASFENFWSKGRNITAALSDG